MNSISSRTICLCLSIILFSIVCSIGESDFGQPASSFSRYQLSSDLSHDSSSPAADGDDHHRHDDHRHAPYPLKVTIDSSSPTGKLLGETSATTPEELGTCNHTCPRVKGCVHEDYFCDSIEDCPDGFDERNCSRTKCQFKCFSNENCLPFQSVCDGTKDCDDESDEAGCTVQPNGCLENQFKCQSGTCIRRAFVCDDVEDCDGEITDELNCPEARFIKTGTQPTRDANLIPLSVKPVTRTTKKTTTTTTDSTIIDDNDVAASDEITSRVTSGSNDKITTKKVNSITSSTRTSTSSNKINPIHTIDPADSNEDENTDDIVNDSTITVDSSLTSSFNSVNSDTSLLIIITSTLINFLLI